MPLTTGRALTRAFLIYLAAAVVTTWPLAWHPLSKVGASVGPGDPFLNLWILGWGMHAVLTDPMSVVTGRVFDANIFHPATGTLAYSDHLLLQSALLTPLYAATGNVVLCYNVLLLASLVCSAVAMHGCVRALIGSEGGAYVAGLAWGFGSYRFAHLLHLQLQSLYWLPLAFLFLHRTVAAKRKRDAVVLGVFAGLQAVSSVYYAVIGGIGLLVSGVTLGLSATRRKRGRLVKRLVLASVVAGAIALPAGVVYVRVQQEQGFGRNLFEASRGEAFLDSYGRVPAGNLLYGRTGLLHQTSTANDAARLGPERELFPGIALLLLALFGVYAGWRADARPLVIAMCAVGATGLVLSLGPDGWRMGYSTLHRFVFGFQAIRAPARFSVLVMFALAMLAALGWRELSSRAHGVRASRTATVATIALVIAIVEWAHVPTALADAPPLVTPVGQWLRNAPGEGAVAVLPLGIDVDSTPAMVQSLEHWRPILNGYSGQRPDFYAALVDVMSTFPSDESLLALRDRDVRFVVTTDAGIPTGAESPLQLRAQFGSEAIYELAWTPEIEARLDNQTAVTPPPIGPIPFRPGERSEYSVGWNGGLALEAGRVTVTVDQSGFRFRVAAATAPWVSRFFEADDQFVTDTDEQLLPKTHERDQREGSRRVTRAYVYDPAGRRVRVAASVDAARQTDATTLPLDRDSRDAIAALFFVRTQPLISGARYSMPVNEAGRSVRLDLEVTGLETIVVRGQTYQAWHLTPVVRQRVERRRMPTAAVWISDDDRKVPLAIDVDAPFGRVRMELVGYERGR